MPDEVAKVFQYLTAEYEATETLESRLAHDADKIETLLQAIEYQAQGHDTSAWRETSLAALRTNSGRELARAIGSTSPQWWSAFAASYHELRASIPSPGTRTTPEVRDNPRGHSSDISRRAATARQRNDGP